MLRELQVEYYKTKVLKKKGKKCGAIYGNIYKLEAVGSTKRKKKSVTEEIDIPSECVLACFDPDTYGTGRTAGSTAQICLNAKHVEEAVRFAAVANRWLDHVDPLPKNDNMEE
jgi:hypothetical protein